MKRVIFPLLCAMLLAPLYACSDDSSNGSNSAATASPTAIPSQHGARARARDYWERIILPLALSETAVHLAQKSASDNDQVSMQQYLTQAEKFADLAYLRAENGEPSGDAWMNIQSEMMTAARSYEDAIGKMKDALDSGSSEGMASALDDANSASESAGSATHDARMWYIAHGGKASDLDDVDTAAKAVTNITDALSGASQ